MGGTDSWHGRRAHSLRATDTSRGYTATVLPDPFLGTTGAGSLTHDTVSRCARGTDPWFVAVSTRAASANLCASDLSATIATAPTGACRAAAPADSDERCRRGAVAAARRRRDNGCVQSPRTLCASVSATPRTAGPLPPLIPSPHKFDMQAARGRIHGKTSTQSSAKARHYTGPEAHVPGALSALAASSLPPSEALLRILKVFPKLLITVVFVHHIDVVAAEQRVPDHERANAP